MPTLTTKKDYLHHLLGIRLTDEELEKILFDFGLELGDVEENDGVSVYKIEIPANRYDLLCTEGLCFALRAFLEMETYEDITVENGDVVVSRNGEKKRPHIACAVISGLNVCNGEKYKSFMEYQEMLHLTIGRNRKLASMGTHDLDKIRCPIYYRNKKPEDVVFVPLNGNEEANWEDLWNRLSLNHKICKYLELIENDENLSCVEDSQGIISLPPVINSDRTKVCMNTKNVFVEVTGTDLNRVNTMLKLFLGNFRGEQVQKVRIVTKDGQIWTPIIHDRVFRLTMGEINTKLGLNLDEGTVEKYLKRMMHRVSIHPEGVIEVKIHDVRSDVLHKCDIIEDIAIAHGLSNFHMSVPALFTVGSENSLNRFSDKLRAEFALMGFDEALTLTLLSQAENLFDGEWAVSLKNSKSTKYEVVRTSLVPGLLKFISSNLRVGAPFKVFEVADVVLIDDENISGAKNLRKLAAVYAGLSACLEEVQGSVSFLLEKCGVQNCKFQLADNEERYLKNQSAVITIGENILGSIGVCNPDVCRAFKVPYAASSFEIDVEKLFAIYTSVHQIHV